MPRIQFTTVIAAPLETVWAFYDDIKTLPRITPPSTRIWLPASPEPMRTGAAYRLHVLQPPIPFPMPWDTIITEHMPPGRFVDIQGADGPFAYWRHEHGFEALPDGRTRIRDTVTYAPPLGLLGWIADRLFIERQLRAMFRYRHEKTREALER